MSCDCGCCAGNGVDAPLPLDNPPGRSALSYRAGTHGHFFRTMLARLSALQAEQTLGGSHSSSHGADGCLGESHRSFLLGGDPDAATALLDAWACIADVLTFYQERIANEGYLGTATEERSVIELGRLTGHEPRPGVAASVHLAFTVQDGFDGEIPERTRTQSLPRPGQTAQLFETSQALLARAGWNAMVAGARATGHYIRREYIARREPGPEVGPRAEVRPRPSSSAIDGSLFEPTGRIEIFLDGVGQNVQAGDVLLVVSDPARPLSETPKPEEVYRVSDVWLHPETAYTTLRLVPIDGQWLTRGEWEISEGSAALDPYANLMQRGATAKLARARRTLEDLARVLSLSDPKPPVGADPLALDPSVQTILALIEASQPELREHLLALVRSVQPQAAPRVHVMRVRAQVFGHAVPPIQEIKTSTVQRIKTSVSEPREHEPADDENPNVVYLAGEYGAIRAGSPLVLRAPPVETPTDLRNVTHVFMLKSVDVQSRLAYGTPSKTTWVELDGKWWQPQVDPHEERSVDITPIRRALVYAQPEPLVLVGQPLDQPVGGSTIDLDRAVDELPGDRLVIVEGERDLPGTSGIRVAELARVASASLRLTRDPPPHRVKSPLGDEFVEFKPTEDGGRSSGYTQITLTAPLRYSYRRSTVIVRGNVAHATHGETRDEILGSGDASQSEQRFTLRQGPRTWESAPTPTGIASTLVMRVDGVHWPEVPAYALPGPRDEVVRSRTLSDRKDEIRGGDGRRGARFPTGIENLTARYRVGLGSGGNVDAGLISALVTRPIGLREVINPLRSSGGADPDGRDEIRMRIPITARAIDRLVSVADHADFALNFAGIDKATARHAGSIVEVVIAGDEDEAIDEGSDLLRNLRAAFQRYGDPLLRPVVRVATAVPLVLQAAVRFDARRDWPQVEAALRERLLLRYGWSARAIAEPAHLSVVLEALQAVPGVRSVDVDMFGPMRPAAAPPAPLRPAPDAASEAATVTRPLRERLLGIAERLRERDADRRWSFAAHPSEVLYFARSAPATVSFTEVV